MESPHAIAALPTRRRARRRLLGAARRADRRHRRRDGADLPAGARRPRRLARASSTCSPSSSSPTYWGARVSACSRRSPSALPRSTSSTCCAGRRDSRSQTTATGSRLGRSSCGRRRERRGRGPRKRTARDRRPTAAAARPISRASWRGRPACEDRPRRRRSRSRPSALRRRSARPSASIELGVLARAMSATDRVRAAQRRTAAVVGTLDAARDGRRRGSRARRASGSSRRSSRCSRRRLTRATLEAEVVETAALQPHVR